MFYTGAFKSHHEPTLLKGGAHDDVDDFFDDLREKLDKEKKEKQKKMEEYFKKLRETNKQRRIDKDRQKND